MYCNLLSVEETHTSVETTCIVSARIVEAFLTYYFNGGNYIFFIIDLSADYFLPCVL